MTPKVLVIGAGPAGIACAYYLQKANIPYLVVDKSDVIASTWASLYPSLKLNTTRFFSHLPERKFPLHYGIFPTGKQYHAYLVNYVHDFGLNIQLGVTVHSVCKEGDGWRVISNAGSAWYPAVISATGRFNAPITPHIDGMESFTGNMIHAHQYLGHEPFIGKRVMVMGNGPSGVDIASELGRSRGCEAVYLSQRTGVVLRPRYPYGLPKHVWTMIGEALPRRIGARLIKHIESLKFENLDKIGIRTPKTDAQSSAAGGTRGRELITAVKRGWVLCVPAPTRFAGDKVILADGTELAVDVVIMGTGYRAVLHDYLKLDAPRDKADWLLREGQDPQSIPTGKRQVLGQRGLYEVGTFYQGKGTMYNINVEAKQAVDEILGQLII
ncbi:MAG: NAD(P)/FAD-dependent oxidoreductase [bacterium]|nr:NAD(P)/FAD-dependent oxidoreductase [bacterium]